MQDCCSSTSTHPYVTGSSGKWGTLLGASLSKRGLKDVYYVYNSNDVDL